MMMSDDCYVVKLTADAADYADGARGVATGRFKDRPGAAVDLIVLEGLAFVLTSVKIGGEELIFGGGEVPAAMFAPTAVGRAFRDHTQPGGSEIAIGFRNPPGGSRGPFRAEVKIYAPRPRARRGRRMKRIRNTGTTAARVRNSGATEASVAPETVARAIGAEETTTERQPIMPDTTKHLTLAEANALGLGVTIPEAACVCPKGGLHDALGPVKNAPDISHGGATCSKCGGWPINGFADSDPTTF